MSVCCYCDAPLSCAACGVEQPSDDASSAKFIAWRVDEIDDATMRNLLESKDVGTGRGRLKFILLHAFGKQL